MLNTKLKLSVAISTLLISQAALAAPDTPPVPDTPVGDMTLWLDASDDTTLFTNETCPPKPKTPKQAKTKIEVVNCWQDKSAKKNNVSVAKNLTPPKLLANALDNKAVVDFTQTALVTKKTGQIKANGSYTKLVVFKLVNEDGNKGVNKISKHNLIGSDPYQTTLWADNGMLHSQHKGSKTNYLNSTKKLGTAKYHIAVTRYSKPDYDPKKPNDAIPNILNLDGKREDENFDKADHTAAKISIGGVGKNGTGENYFYLDGQIAEALVYDRSLTDNDIILNEKYLAVKWGLKLGQNIIFKKPKNQVKGNPDIVIHAISSSGIEVTFSSKTLGICKISKNSSKDRTYVTLDAIGTCKIEANAEKDNIYPKAAPVMQSFEIKAVKDDTTEAPNTNPPSSSGGSGGGTPLPLGLALLGLIALIRRKLKS